MTAPTPRDVAEILIKELDLRNHSAATIDVDALLFGSEGLGLDSLDALQIAIAIEEHYGVKIPEGDEARPIFRSIRTITDYVTSHSTTPT